MAEPAQQEGEPPVPYELSPEDFEVIWTRRSQNDLQLILEALREHGAIRVTEKQAGPA